MIRLDGKRVVLTGAGGGVGTRMVAAFRDAGAQIVVCEREGVDLPADLETHRFDLADPAAVGTAAEAIIANGPPDIFVSNAGVTHAEMLDELTPASLAFEMAANFTGAAELSRRLSVAMRGRGGAMVFVASVNALSHHGNPAYSAAKAALLAWMRALAVEEGRYGLRANAICPGSIHTPVWDARIAADAGVLDNVAKLYPLGRFVTPDEVAQAVLFLSSPLASGITGVTMPVDAGLMAGNLPFIDAIT